MNYWATSWPIWLSALCVLSIYSFLIKDNPVYRVMIQVFIGANLGYQAVIQWRDVLYPQWWLPMVDGFRALFGGPGSPWGAMWALVGMLGLLFYFQLSRKYFWLSRIVIGITIGIGAGLTFKSQFGQNMPQIVDSFKPLAPAVVAPAPTVAVSLPGTDFAPAVADPLAFFVSGRQVTAVETLGGVVVWRTTIQAQPALPPKVVGDAVVVPTTAGTVGIDVSTGRPIANPPPYPRSTFVKEPFGQDSGHVYGLSGQRLNVLMRSRNTLLGNIDLPSKPTASPTMALYDQPQFDEGVVLVPFGREVNAYALKNGVTPNVRRGDRLWSARAPEAVTSLTALDGTLLVAGSRASQLWTLPVPSPRLTASDYFDNWVFVITMLTVMTYFFFSFRTEGRAIKGASQLGRWILMIGFGAFFGNTVMTRMSYLLDRLMFLIDDWLRPFFHHLFG